MIQAKVKRRQIHDADKGLREGLEVSVAKIAIAIEGQAKLDAPVDTGILRASITRNIEGLNASVGSNVEYAIYQEEGTRYMRAANQGQGFLKPAIEKVRSKLSAIVGKNIRIGIRSN